MQVFLDTNIFLYASTHGCLRAMLSVWIRCYAAD
jgi:predicted nucleic acid-binding protein